MKNPLSHAAAAPASFRLIDAGSAPRSSPDPGAAASSFDPSAGRLAWLDRARGFGILLVVVGHVLGGMVASGLVPDVGPWARAIDVLYSFHMPLFFFLSGLVAEAGRPSSVGAFVSGRLRTLAWPYLVWSLLQVGLHALASPMANQQVEAGALLRIAWEPVQQFWFLYVLFLLVVAWNLLRRAGFAAATLLAVAVFAWFVPGRGSLGSWGVAYMVAAQAVWFAAGGTLGAARASRALDGCRHAFALSLLLFVVLSALALEGYGSPTATGVLGLDLLRGAIAPRGIAASLLLAASFGRFAVPGLVLQRLGEASLAIYLAHTIVAAATRVALVKVAGVSDPLVHVVGASLAGVVFPFLLDRACTLAGLRWIFTFPSPRTGEATAVAVVPALQEG